MKRYAMQDLINKWEREDLTIEQAIGQMLLWLGFLIERVTKLERTSRKTNLPQNE